ncbi:ABC-type branched-subunit amino acid transport system substrate-binding protein [Marmoricola sp. OAE513]|uniref:ABC transporter substrate-binding protein n=1 Tax=Marmoricola sp. OAE513 TaxID=2817894 RepID=UPI001AE26FD6
MRDPRRRLLAVVAFVLLGVLGVTACGGSQMSPKAVQEANRKAAGLGPGDSVGPNGQLPESVANPDDPQATTGPNDPSVPNGPADPSNPDQPQPGGPGAEKGDPLLPSPSSCAGFKNQTGITDSTITIGNGADISGPVPGLFTATQQATKAYVSYFNSKSSICGRKLKLITADTRTDAGADQQASAKFCEQAFATVGGMATFDSGGAAAAQACGLPDLRAVAVTGDRNRCKVCFAAEATGDHEFSNAVPDFFVKNYKAASKKAAFLYLNVGAAAENGVTQRNVAVKRGFDVVYTKAIDVAEFNYGPYVQQLKTLGVRWVQFLGAYQQEVRFAEAMKAANYKPDVYMLDPSAYDEGFLQTGGDAIENTFVYVNFTPFAENAKEFRLYNTYLQQVAPGAKPTFFGLFAWSAAKLFVEQSIELGGKLSRPALVNSLRGVKNWTAGDLHGPMQVGAKHAPSCIRFLQVKNNKFVPIKGTKYVCNGYSKG